MTAIQTYLYAKKSKEEKVTSLHMQERNSSSILLRITRWFAQVHKGKN
jgi:hypothetical protein